MSIRIIAAGVLGIAIACTPVNAGARDDHLQCFKIRDPLRLKALVDLTSSQLGVDEGCKVAKARFLCVPTTKGVIEVTGGEGPIDPLPLDGPPAPGDRICYVAKCPRRETAIPAQEVTDQFGTRTVARLVTKMVCTPAVPGLDWKPDKFRGLPATGQTSCWNYDYGAPVPCSAAPGEDGAVRAGAALRYADNGDGTITDLNTGLMWEKKVADGGLHDFQHYFPWSGSCSFTGLECQIDANCPSIVRPFPLPPLPQSCFAPDAQGGDDTVFEWVARLNAGSGFAGHTDWRIPNWKELESIVNYGRDWEPFVSDTFNSGCVRSCSNCSCTSLVDWSSTTDPQYPSEAVGVEFGAHRVDRWLKTHLLEVRAVRGGLSRETP